MPCNNADPIPGQYPVSMLTSPVVRLTVTLPLEEMIRKYPSTTWAFVCLIPCPVGSGIMAAGLSTISFRIRVGWVTLCFGCSGGGPCSGTRPKSCGGASVASMLYSACAVFGGLFAASFTVACCVFTADCCSAPIFYFEGNFIQHLSICLVSAPERSAYRNNCRYRTNA